MTSLKTTLTSVALLVALPTAAFGSDAPLLPPTCADVATETAPLSDVGVNVLSVEGSETHAILTLEIQGVLYSIEVDGGEVQSAELYEEGDFVASWAVDDQGSTATGAEGVIYDLEGSTELDLEAIAESEGYLAAALLDPALANAITGAYTPSVGASGERWFWVVLVAAAVASCTEISYDQTTTEPTTTYHSDGTWTVTPGTTETQWHIGWDCPGMISPESGADLPEYAEATLEVTTSQPVRGSCDVEVELVVQGVPADVPHYLFGVYEDLDEECSTDLEIATTFNTPGSLYHYSGSFSVDEDTSGVVYAGAGGIGIDAASWSCVCTPLEGDFDGDGAVGISDLLYFNARFGGSDPECDLDGDGVVAMADLLIVLQNYGAQGC